MGRTKITVDVAVLGQRGRALHVVLGSGTTASEVIRKVLEKCRVSDSPLKYQLAVVSDKERVLRDEERPAAVHPSAMHFALRQRTSALVRVYHNLDGDLQSFQSLIVTPSMAARDLLQVAVARAAPRESPEGFSLVLRIPTGERILESTEHPFLIQGSSNHLQLKRKRQVSPAAREDASHASRSPTLSLSSPFLPPSITLPQSRHSLAGSDSPSTGSMLLSPTLTPVELQRGKLQLHSELIDALKLFATHSQTTAVQDGQVKSRESVLEQALVEQNQILDVMQEFVSSLEMENKFSRDKINAQAITIQENSSWESRCKTAEKQLKELNESSRMLESRKAGMISFAAVSGFEKVLAEKDQLIASLQAKLDSLPREVKQRAGLGGGGVVRSESMALVASTRAKLEAERVRVIELEEELSSRREELNKLRSELSGKRSVLINKESEILHLRHEMEALKKSSGQQQEVVMRLRTSLIDKDVQLTSLTSALSKEKKLVETLRNKQLQSFSPLISDSSAHVRSPHLFEQVLGRDIRAVELTRPAADTEFGFSYTKVELPVSSRAPCLVVKAVKDGTIADGVLQPGDELLEVNGYSCRSTAHHKAIGCLEKTVGMLRVVIARDQEPSGFEKHLQSTPLSSKTRSTLWATALSDINPNASITTVSSLPLSESESTEFVSILNSPTSPQVFQLPLQEEESAVAVITRLQTEITELKVRLHQYNQAGVELENELEVTRGDLDGLQMEYDLTKAENFELQEQINSSDVDMEEIQGQVSELQKLLVQVQEQAATEHAKISALDAKNQSLENQLKESQSAHESAKKASSDAKIALEKLSLETSKQTKDLNEEIAMLRSQNDQLRADISHRESDIEEMKAKLETQKARYEDCLSSLREQNKRELISLREASARSTSSNQEEIDALRLQLNSAKSLLMEAEMKQSTTEVELRHHKQAAGLANQQLAKVERNYKKVRDEVGSYKQIAESKSLEMETLTLGLRAAQSKLESNKEMVTRLQNNMDQLRRANAKMQADKAKMEKARSRTESRLSSIESEQALLEEKFTSSVEERDMLFQQLEESTSEAASFQQQVETLNLKVSELKGNVEMSKQRESHLEKQMRELSSAKRSTKEEFSMRIEQLKAENAVLEQVLSRAHSDAEISMESSQSSADRALQEVSRLQGEIEHQRDALVTSEKERVDLNLQCEALRKTNLKQSQELESLNTEKEALSHTVGLLKTAQDDTRSEVEAKQRKVDELSEQCSSLQQNVQALEERCESLRRELQDSKREIERLTVQSQEQADQVVETQLQLGQLSRDLDQKNQEWQESRATCEQLKEELTIVRGRNEQLRAKNKKLQAHNDSLHAVKKQSEDMVSSMEFVHQQDQAQVEQLSEKLRCREKELQKVKEELQSLQTESKSQTQQLQGDNSNLRESIETLKNQLEDSIQAREAEVSKMKEHLHSCEQELSGLKEDLQAQRSANSINQATINQLQAAVEQANEEREGLQKSLQDATEHNQHLQTENRQLREQVMEIQQAKTQLESDNISLTSERVFLKQKLRQSSGQVDNLTAKVHALEMNMLVAKRGLEESEQAVTEWREKASGLDTELKQAVARLEGRQSEVEEAALELYAREEALSQLKTTLKLRQKECEQLQQSFVLAQSKANNRKQRIQSLEAEKRDLEATIGQLKECQEGLRNSLMQLEKEKAAAEEQYESSTASLSQELEEFKTKEKQHLEEIQKLESSYQESQSIADQFLAAQEALKTSLSTLGDEKEVKILKLGNQLSELEVTLAGCRQELSKSHNREAKLQFEAQDFEAKYKATLEQNERLNHENERLRGEVELHQTTEKELTELHTKISLLENNTRTKTEKLSTAEQSLQGMELEMKVTRAENKGFLEKISELASVKVSLAEERTELQRIRGELANEMKAKQELGAERDQLLSMLRKLEVEKHTAAVQQTTPKLSRGADKEQLLELLRDKEEEAFRLREYVGKLLSNVVERAPFVLEKMH